MDLLEQEFFNCCPAGRCKLPRKVSIPAGNDIIRVYGKLPEANSEAYLELRRLNVERRYVRLDTFGDAN